MGRRRIRTMKHEFYLEHKVAEEEWEEWEYEVEFSATPYDPGVSSGPIHRCYPPEGGEADVESVRRRPTFYKQVGPQHEWQETTYEQFLENYVASHETKPSRWKDAMGVAEEEIEQELLEAAEEWARAEYEAYEESKYDYMKEEGLI